MYTLPVVEDTVRDDGEEKRAATPAPLDAPDEEPPTVPPPARVTVLRLPA